MTLRCAGPQVRVRLYCIDAPEMGQVPRGRESRDYLRSITPSSVALVVHGDERCGVAVAAVFAGDKGLNLSRVEAGEAARYPGYCHEKRNAATERAAQVSHLGIRARPGQQQTPGVSAPTPQGPTVSALEAMAMSRFAA
jgi:endonuclease YncB( thermonuclease family)